MDGINGYVCNCAPGYEKRHCGVNTDECASDPCQNGATCNDQINGYDCTCAPGYAGKFQWLLFSNQNLNILSSILSCICFRNN